MVRSTKKAESIGLRPWLYLLGQTSDFWCEQFSWDTVGLTGTSGGFTRIGVLTRQTEVNDPVAPITPNPQPHHSSAWALGPNTTMDSNPTSITTLDSIRLASRSVSFFNDRKKNPMLHHLFFYFFWAMTRSSFEGEHITFAWLVIC
jgi:hypothetical protein